MSREISREPLSSLNQQVLVGFTEKTGMPWWYRKELQGEESSVYEGAVPREDVERRLFSWEALKFPVLLQKPDGTTLRIEDQFAIVHGQTGHVFKIAHTKYVIHQYRDWLVDITEDILGTNDLFIGTAGLLRRGAGAFVTIERPDSVVSRNGMELRSRLLAASSHDSRYASTYKMVNTIVVCDNTLDQALYRERGEKYRVRHTMNSKLRIPDVREALNLMVKSDQEVVEFVDSLADVTVSEAQWQEIVDRLVAIPTNSLPRVKARLENKRNEIDELWRTDYRCAPWRGSALGVFQAFNTYRFHFAGPSASGTPNPEQRFNRNVQSLISDHSVRSDRDVLTVIKSVAQRN